MRFLVLGASSFSGASFVRFLLDRGHQVLGTVRQEPHRAFLPYRWKDYPKGQLQVGHLDVNRDLHSILRAMLTSWKPTHVVSFPALGMVRQSWEHPVAYAKTNLVAVADLLEVLRVYDGLEKFIFVGTPEVYGSVEHWVGEERLFRPSTPYAITRGAADHLVRAYHRQYGLPVVVTRAANIYGAGQRLWRLIPRAMIAAMGGPKLVLDGGGTDMRCFVHIDDVCEATLLVATKGVVGEAYHISSIVPLTILDMAEQAIRACGREPGDCMEVGRSRGNDAVYLLSSQKLRALGWRDAMGLGDGLQGVRVWVEHHWDEFLTMPLTYTHG